MLVELLGLMWRFSWFPGILEPKEHHYMIDPHHLGMALLEEAIEHTRPIILKDFPNWLLMSFGR
jgi:hypothetical protein